MSNQVAVLDFKLENPTLTASQRVAGLEDFFEVALQKQDVPVLERRNPRSLNPAVFLLNHTRMNHSGYGRQVMLDLPQEPQKIVHINSANGPQ